MVASIVSPALTFLKTSALSILYFIVIPSIQPSTFPWLTVRLLAVASTPSTFPRRVWVFLASCDWPTASAENSRIVIMTATNLAKARRAARLFMNSSYETYCDTRLCWAPSGFRIVPREGFHEQEPATYAPSGAGVSAVDRLAGVFRFCVFRFCRDRRLRQ